MSDGFYQAFEAKHRGSRELIKSRLRAYLPFVEPLVELDKGAKTLDLGCGRGEWLELMAEVGFKSHGVDLDEGMLSVCVKLGLSVDQGDAIASLAALPSESQAIVSAFHVVEHISFEQLQTVVSEALRILKPGGLLMMETPNPENIVVATCNFYLDPTHQRPIPPQLLSFLAHYHGFARVKTIRLQEPKNLTQSASLTLHDVLGGVSPDYAVIAQKTATAEVLKKIDTAFEDEYGLSLATLATRYDAQLGAKAEHAQAQAQQAGVKAEHAQAQAQQAGVKAEHAQAQAQQAGVKAEHAQAQAQQLRQELYNVFNSRSWRITAPLRWCGLQARSFREQGLLARIKVLIKKIAWSFVHRGLTFFNAHPDLKDQAVVLAQRLGVYQSLRSVYCRLSGHAHLIRDSAGHADRPNLPNELSQLTPRAREVYAELTAAIENKKDFH
jgi:O-antigen chain-terminating methyltransferase